MQKTKYKKISVLFSAVVIFILSCFSVAAKTNTSATMTLICKKDNTILTGMNWDIYYIGQRTENTYTLEGAFADYPVSIDATSTDSMVNAAATLENYAVVDHIPYTNAGIIDADGYLKFTGLASGLYLVSGNVFNQGVVFYQPTPVLVEINLEFEKPDIDLIVYPKIKYALLSEIDMNNIVKKLWIDSKETHEPIDVDIYKNGDFYESVTLSEENKWSYNWTATEYAQWRVREVNAPPEYSVNYKSDNGKFIIENTFHGVEPTTVVTTTAPPTVLPQTGQMWWPVFVLGFGGIILIIIGLSVKGKKRSKK